MPGHDDPNAEEEEPMTSAQAHPMTLLEELQARILARSAAGKKNPAPLSAQPQNSSLPAFDNPFAPRKDSEES
jgi:hypothetical protein